MIRKIESQKFRKHPSGIQSVIIIFKIALLITLGLTAISLVVGILAMFEESVSVNVVSKANDLSTSIKGSFQLLNIKTTGTLIFEPRNFLEWLLLPRNSGFDVYINSLSIIITWQLYRILQEINLDNPFYGGILSRIKIVYRVIFYGLVFSTLKYVYFASVISNVTDGAYKLTLLDYVSVSGYFSFGAWAIVYLFAHVYKKGVMLQQEQELTI